MNKTVLVTGAAGRIGSVLARGLAAAGCELRLTDLAAPAEMPPRSSFAAADITDFGAMVSAAGGTGALIHLAGHPNSRDWPTIERLNMQGTRTVFEAAIAAGVRRIVYASSIHAVGLHPADTPMTADLPLAADSPYGVSKAYGETMLAYLCREHGVTGVALRICSFRGAPTNARELRTWISPPDMVRLAKACLTAELPEYCVVWGVSANRRARVDREMWVRIGYAPQDEAEDHLPELRAAGVDTSLVSEHKLLGGHFVSARLAERTDQTAPRG